MADRIASRACDSAVDDADDTFELPVSPMADTERVFAALAGGHGGAG